MKALKLALVAAPLCLVAAGLQAQTRTQAGADAPAASPSKVDSQALRHWQDVRFGMFIHWGPVSQTGKEISWSRGKQIPIEEYDNLYKTFNPQKFNAETWVNVAKAAGMKYIVLTTKHHDGFCLWDTKQTDYNIMHTPFKRDVVKELSEACHRQGIEFGCYYSTTDWHHPDFPLTGPGGKVTRDHSDLEKYTDYLKAQVRELLANDGPLITLWFDVPQKFDAQRGQGVIDMARSIQPTIVINNRTGARGDYSTPEQKVGKFDRERPWESCMTVSAHNHWAWGGDKDGVKPLKAIVRMLAECAGGDGNMLLNVGPRPDGEIDAQQVARLKEVGAWLNTYKESIYATRGGPYKPGDWGAATCKGNDIYLHIFLFDDGNSIALPPINRKIIGSKLLSGGDVDVKQDAKGVTVSVPFSDQQEISTVVKLELDGPAFDIPPVSVGQSDSKDPKAEKPQAAKH